MELAPNRSLPDFAVYVGLIVAVCIAGWFLYEEWMAGSGGRSDRDKREK